MLFDEKKMPYHLMLQKFLLSGGQAAFFDAFYWALSIGYSIPPEDGLDADLPEFTGEFLDSWLVLLEKMVNPKAVLESPHTLPKTASKATGGNYKPFDPLKYLTRTHRLAFQAVMKVWGKKPLKTYGARMSESVLTILCHILKGEKLIKEKMAQASAASSSSSLMSLSGGNPIPVLSSATSASFSARASSLLAEVAAVSVTLPPQAVAPPPQAVAAPAVEAPEVNQADVATLMDMGFPRERY
jgi:E3 ubiquitin-protein ligase HUWE1